MGTHLASENDIAIPFLNAILNTGFQPAFGVGLVITLLRKTTLRKKSAQKFM